MFQRKQKDQAHGQTIIRRLAGRAAKKGWQGTLDQHEKENHQGEQSKRDRAAGQRALNEKPSRSWVKKITEGNEQRKLLTR